MCSSIFCAAVRHLFAVEHDCLIYSFDIRLTGADGVEEVWVDAGSGRRLAQRHEAAQREAEEIAEEG
jgi:hypothetical protein